MIDRVADSFAPPPVYSSCGRPVTEFAAQLTRVENGSVSRGTFLQRYEATIMDAHGRACEELRMTDHGAVTLAREREIAGRTAQLLGISYKQVRQLGPAPNYTEQPTAGERTVGAGDRLPPPDYSVELPPGHVRWSAAQADPGLTPRDSFLYQNLSRMHPDAPPY